MPEAKGKKETVVQDEETKAAPVEGGKAAGSSEGIDTSTEEQDAWKALQTDVRGSLEKANEFPEEPATGPFDKSLQMQKLAHLRKALLKSRLAIDEKIMQQAQVVNAMQLRTLASPDTVAPGLSP